MSQRGGEGGRDTDNAIDGHDFTEDDAKCGSVSKLAFFLECRYGPDEVLGSYTWCADTTAEDRRASDEDPPAVGPTIEHKTHTNRED